VAVSADGRAWFLLNVSADVRAQVEAFPALHPRGLRHSPIAGVVLTSGDLDHCLGLLVLREWHPLVVYATEPVRRGFTEGNVLYRTLERVPGQVTWRVLKPEEDEELAGPDGRPAGLAVRAVPVPGKPPLHLAGRRGADPADTVALLVRDRSGRTLAYAPGVAAVTDDVRRLVGEADVVFFDGTFWSSDEMPALGLGARRAEDMAHVPMSGPGGSLAALAGLRAAARVYIHINNTNPVLREDSPERRAVEAAGWAVAWDGMELRV
jgi:pyrroloquinoline quinone biosynthesis protein B